MMARRIRRWLLLAPLLPLALLGCAVWWVYDHPPLAASVGALCCKDRPGGILGINLMDQGRWPVRLTSVTVHGNPGDYQVEALVSPSSELASSVAWRSIIWEKPDKPQPQTGPVSGWAVEPTHLGQPGRNHGLRVTWAAGTDAPHSIIVQFRYLGLPMKVVVDGT